MKGWIDVQFEQQDLRLTLLSVNGKKASENVFYRPDIYCWGDLWTTFLLPTNLSLFAHVFTFNSWMVDGLCDCLLQQVSHYRNHCLVLCI